MCRARSRTFFSKHCSHLRFSTNCSSKLPSRTNGTAGRYVPRKRRPWQERNAGTAADADDRAADRLAVDLSFNFPHAAGNTVRNQTYHPADRTEV
jgi:hypothetical protein